MARAYSPREVMGMKKVTIPFTGGFFDAFGWPERKGVWFVWGGSGNGKSSFMMQLCKELASSGMRVIYNSLEEGVALTMQNSLMRHGMDECNGRLQVLDGEPLQEFIERMGRHKSPDVMVIDSFQYTQMNYKAYLEFKKVFKNKLTIFVSHADGKQPAGRAAKSVRYDADLKIWVEGYIAYSTGRYYGPNGGVYTIWSEGAERYEGKILKNKII